MSLEKPEKPTKNEVFYFQMEILFKSLEKPEKPIKNEEYIFL